MGVGGGSLPVTWRKKRVFRIWRVKDRVSVLRQESERPGSEMMDCFMAPPAARDISG